MTFDNRQYHHKERKNVINCLSRIGGNIKGVKQMAIDGRHGPDILL